MTSQAVQSNPLNGSPVNGSIWVLVQVLVGPILVLTVQNVLVTVLKQSWLRQKVRRRPLAEPSAKDLRHEKIGYRYLPKLPISTEPSVSCPGLGMIPKFYNYSVGQINEVRGWFRTARVWAARDQPLTSFISPTEYFCENSNWSNGFLYPNVPVIVKQACKFG